MKQLFFLTAMLTLLACQPSNTNTPNDEPDTTPRAKTETATKTHDQAHSAVKISPISHASFVLHLDSLQIFVDPVNVEAFKSYGTPNYLLVTDIHGDHFQADVLSQLSSSEQRIIAPQAVFDQLPVELQSRTLVLNNGQSEQLQDSLQLKAMPMYNITKERLDKHPKGRGNGYIVTYKDYSVYISGDTEDITEMRALEHIDLALVCMNLPYTMDVDQAAEAVLDFKPKKVMPYHYRGLKEGKPYYEDVEKFKAIVTEKDPTIKIELLDWYE